MKVTGFDNLRGEDTYIYYRRTYSAKALLEFLNKQASCDITFTIEVGPLGNKDIYVEYPNGLTFDYPLLPVTKAIKEYILLQDNEGSLPS